MSKVLLIVKRGVLLVLIFSAASIKAQGISDDEVSNKESPTGYILATGRRLPFLYAISLDEAINVANNNTANAIISRNKVALDRLDGQLLGDPANLLLSEEGETVYVINHHGSIDNGEFSQHGGRGQIAVLQVDALLDSRNDRTANALIRLMDSGGFGAIGAILLPDLLVVNNAENNLTEDGGNRIAFIDRRTGSLRSTVELSLGSPGFQCQDYPVPYVAPYGPPRNLTVLSSDPSFGCFPNPNGLAMGVSSDGTRYLFTANGGTDDVSVVNLERALAGDRGAELHRIPDQQGAWGITATPDGKFIFVASGGSQRAATAGNTISVLDVDRARESGDAEIARVLVGIDDPQQASHPLIPSVTPDGRELVVPNLRGDNVSIIDIELAVSGDANAEVARIPLTRLDGNPARPKGSAISPDGRYAIISGGSGSQPYSQELGYVYIIDLQTRSLVGTVVGVGNDPYGLAVVYR